ncbi:MAG: type III pantothenate kinase [Alphaproteobacteria bacterium]|nr:MAG: type III pantothenate kinase [Alphaproteobacteria bacterium]
MLLAIDSGNTNVVFAVCDGGGEVDEVRARWRTSTDPRRTADEYAVWLTQLMALEGLHAGDIDGAIIANVVPAAGHELKTLCRRYFKTDPLVVGEAGVRLGIDVHARQVGEDRLVNAVAAHQAHGGPLIVIDFGTATTFDVIGADGTYEGGVIAPGINLSLEALDRAAAKLPRIALEGPPDTVIGHATVPAMQSGAYWGYVGLLEGIVERIKAELGAPAKVIATGGLAPLFARGTACIDDIDPDITLRGLRLIYRANRGQAGPGESA